MRPDHRTTDRVPSLRAGHRCQVVDWSSRRIVAPGPGRGWPAGCLPASSCPGWAASGNPRRLALSVAVALTREAEDLAVAAASPPARGHIPSPGTVQVPCPAGLGGGGADRPRLRVGRGRPRIGGAYPLPASPQIFPGYPSLTSCAPQLMLRRVVRRRAIGARYTGGVKGEAAGPGGRPRAGRRGRGGS